jgi:hypothetical protein
MLRQVAIEVETDGAPRTMFRLLIDGRMIFEGLTAQQARILTGEILERMASPASKGPKEARSRH